MADLEQLRVAFCSILLQARGSVVSNFVAWLDLKVAEYKVYGHMILTDDKESEIGACQYNVNIDPSSWPKSTAVRLLSQASDVNIVHNDSSGEIRRNTQPSSSARRKGRPSYISKILTLGGRRTARPKSVVTSLLKNAISRSAKSSTVQPILTDVSGLALRPVGECGSLNEDDTGTGESSGPPLEMESTPAVPEHSEHDQILNDDAETSDKDKETVHKLTTVKAEPGMDDSSELDDVSVIEPKSPPETEEADNMWLNESMGSVFPDMPDFSHGASVNPVLPSTSSGGEFQSSMVPRPSHKQLLPSRHSYSGLSHRSPSASSSLVLSSVSRSLLTSQATRGVPRNNDSVNDLLETHTIQTESGLVCRICESKVKRRTHMRAHLLEQHLGIAHMCPVCKHTFSRRRALKYHMDKVHACSLPI